MLQFQITSLGKFEVSPRMYVIASREGNVAKEFDTISYTSLYFCLLIKRFSSFITKKCLVKFATREVNLTEAHETICLPFVIAGNA